MTNTWSPACAVKTMMSINLEQVHTALKGVIDPNTGRDFLATKSARNIRVDGNDISLDVELAIPRNRRSTRCAARSSRR